MSRRARIVTARLLLALFVTISSFAPAPATAAQGDCSQPVSNGARPVATDCLFILNAAVQLATCTPTCTCAPKGSLPITATDALVCLRGVVDLTLDFDCPCSSGSLTTTTTDTTSTTTTSNTTTTLPEVSCTIDAAPCTTTLCTCFGVADGLDYHLGASGQVYGPVGTQLRVNTQLENGGTIDCHDWTQIDASVNPSCDTIGCCQRESGQPTLTEWEVYENFDLPCFCPEAPGPLEANYIAQCQLGNGQPIESPRTTDPCP